MLSNVLGAITARPLPPGTKAPRLSLTADDGRWIRLEDHVGHRQVALVFFQKANPDTAQWLAELSARTADLEAVSTTLIGVHSGRTDKMRAYKGEAGITFPVAYDPLAIDSRGWRAASRWRPIVKDAVYLIDEAGCIAWGLRGRPSADDIIAAAAAASGVEAPVAAESGLVPAVQQIDSDRAVELLAEPGYLLLDVRTASEYDADHAPNAVHIPLDQLPQRVEELGQTEKVLCICQAGGRSQAAAEFLSSAGFNETYNILGGMSGWSGDRITGGKSQP